MDSLTQVVLGGAVGYAVLGNKVGRKAAIYGAILGTLPDLDVFLPYGGEVEAFTYHRGFSHSLFVHLLASPLIAWLINKWHSADKAYFKWWCCLVFLCLSTHALLDSCTVYGTQLMWPLTEHPFGVSNLFIIDPLYTIPLLIAFIFMLLPARFNTRAYTINTIALGLSSLYIVWSLAVKVYIDQKVELAMVERNIVGKHYLSTPAPFSTLLWRVLIMSDNAYYEGYVSIFDEVSEVSLTPYVSSQHLLENIQDEWGLKRLQWFTKGFYSIEQREQKVVLSDLRMGAECNYVFNFAVGEIDGNTVTVGDYEKSSQRPNLSQVALIWDRIWDPSVSLAPNKVDGRCY